MNAGGEQRYLLARAHSRPEICSLDRWVDRRASERAAVADDHAPGRRPPRARKADVSSSHRAADEIEGSGAVAEQQRIALAAIRSYPGSTSKELAGITEPPRGMDATAWRYALARRATELADRDLVWRTLLKSDDMRLWPAGYAIPEDAGERIYDRRKKKAS